MLPVIRRQRTAAMQDGGVVVPYYQQLINLFGANLIQYMPFNDLSGTQATDISGNDRHGTYTNVTLNQAGMGDGQPSVLIGATGSVSSINSISASLQGALNYKELTASVWCKFPAWGDGIRRVVFYGYKSTSYSFYVQKSAASDYVQATYLANGTSKNTLSEFGGTLNFFQVTMTVSYSNDRLRLYVNGVQQGGEITGLGEWVGNDITSMLWGRLNTNTELGGNLQHGFILNKEATPEEVAASFFPG